MIKRNLSTWNTISIVSVRGFPTRRCVCPVQHACIVCGLLVRQSVYCVREFRRRTFLVAREHITEERVELSADNLESRFLEDLQVRFTIQTFIVDSAGQLVFGKSQALVNDVI